ncbi:hypothetical protein C8Q77DRAFT_848840 [Trametes polyzona]|nr:hypothetical protein C8Q77DRAFT_848840 [Trametes polyzona]
MQLLNPSPGLFFILCTQGVIALVTTLYIPLVDPQPITADIEGVDASGHTTWRLGPGVPSGTLTQDAGSPFPSATLVAGPTDVHFVAVDPTEGASAQVDCGLGRTADTPLALCTLVDSDPAIGGVVTRTIVDQDVGGFAVQVGAGATSTMGAGQTLPASSSAASVASVDSGSASAGASAPTSAATTAPNHASKVQASVWGIALLGVTLVWVCGR